MYSLLINIYMKESFFARAQGFTMMLSLQSFRTFKTIGVICTEDVSSKTRLPALPLSDGREADRRGSPGEKNSFQWPDLESKTLEDRPAA